MSLFVTRGPLRACRGKTIQDQGLEVCSADHGISKPHGSLRPAIHRSASILICAFALLSATTHASHDTKSDFNNVVRRAFEQTHDGWSSDEVLLQDPLNRRFISRCQLELPDAKAGELNWALLNLRKAGKLTTDVTRRRRDDHQDYRHLAEIVSRLLQNKHRVSTDRIMCDPVLRKHFDETAKSLTDVDPYLLRKAAFGLRKTSQLRPELVLRVADWDRKITTHLASDLVGTSGTSLPTGPGIYIFRDSTGYLYVGESKNLRDRIVKHLNASDRQSLAHYLKSRGFEKVTIEIHAFPPDSRARLVAIRRAYESELIASRKPRLNVRP